jgi:hypothetical protein
MVKPILILDVIKDLSKFLEVFSSQIFYAPNLAFHNHSMIEEQINIYGYKFHYLNDEIIKKSYKSAIINDAELTKNIDKDTKHLTVYHEKKFCSCHFGCMRCMGGYNRDHIADYTRDAPQNIFLEHLTKLRTLRIILAVKKIIIPASCKSLSHLFIIHPIPCSDEIRFENLINEQPNFSNLRNILIHNSLIQEFVVPDSATKLSHIKMIDLPNCKKVYIPPTCTNVEHIRFLNLKKLTEFNIPLSEKLKTITVSRSLIQKVIVPDCATELSHFALSYLPFCEKTYIPSGCTKIESIDFDNVKKIDGLIIPPSPNLERIVLLHCGDKIENFVLPEECKNVKIIKICVKEKIDKVIIPLTYTKLKTLICDTYSMDLLKIPESCKLLNKLEYPLYITKFQVHSNILKNVELEKLLDNISRTKYKF